MKNLFIKNKKNWVLIKPNFFIFLAGILFLTSCFAPVNLKFDNAGLLEKGEVKFTGSGSSYYGDGLFTSGKVNDNYGFALSCGIAENYNMRLRYERLNTKYEIIIFDVDLNEADLDYFEIGNKFGLKKNKTAVDVSLGIYQYEQQNLFVLTPSFLWTFMRSKNVELTLMPKAYLSFNDEIDATPALSIGAGFSSDLDKWAIRPEIGYDGYPSFGVGVDFKIPFKK